MSWYVRNVRDLKWYDVGPRGFVTELVDGEGEEPQVGFNLFVLAPGNPMAMYHWEADQEGFLVISGEALLIVEEEERTLRQWDYFHCPPNVPHTIVGAGSRPCAILALGARDKSVGDDWGGYPYSEVAMKHDASAEEETTEPQVAYARFPSGKETEFQEGWLA